MVARRNFVRGGKVQLLRFVCIAPFPLPSLLLFLLPLPPLFFFTLHPALPSPPRSGPLNPAESGQCYRLLHVAANTYI